MGEVGRGGVSGRGGGDLLVTGVYSLSHLLVHALPVWEVIRGGTCLSPGEPLM